MKHLIAALTLFMSTESFGQFAISPNGATSVSTPPVGHNRVSQCGKRGCFEVNIMPYCFGTNLRAYSPEIQLKQDEDVIIKVNLGGSSGDKFEVKFPAALTFASDGLKVGCEAIPGQNLATTGTRNFKCLLPSSAGDKELIYSIADWRGTKNPSCYAGGGSHGAEYCDYAARPLDGNLISGSHIDAKITCLYSFDASYKLKPELKCYFPSMLPDESSKVKVSIGGTETSVPDVKAVTNSIVVGVPLNATTWVKDNVELAKGVYSMPKEGESLPAAEVSFFQKAADGSLRNLEKTGYQLPDKIVAFEEVNQNMSLTISAKLIWETNLN